MSEIARLKFEPYIEQCAISAVWCAISIKCRYSSTQLQLQVFLYPVYMSTLVAKLRKLPWVVVCLCQFSIRGVC